VKWLPAFGFLGRTRTLAVVTVFVDNNQVAGGCKIWHTARQEIEETEGISGYACKLVLEFFWLRRVVRWGGDASAQEQEAAEVFRNSLGRNRSQVRDAPPRAPCPVSERAPCDRRPKNSQHADESGILWPSRS
jgi:hypothetical protein